VPRHEHPRLQAAVAAELTRLLAEGSLAPGLLAGEAVERLQGGEVQMTIGGQAGALGGQIARAIYGGIGHATNDRD
jgi:hypothetical protein